MSTNKQVSQVQNVNCARMLKHQGKLVYV